MGVHLLSLNLNPEKIALQMAKTGQNFQEVATAAGMSKAGLYSILQKDRVRPVTAGKIANALHCDVSDIIS